MNRSDRIKALGRIGEEVNRQYLELQGHTVIMSDDQFDSIKDMTADGLTVETKTLVKIKKYNAFCLGSSQSRKCEEVDRLFFIEIPTLPDDGIKIWESLKPRKYFEQFFNGDNCRMYSLDSLLLCSIVYNIEQSTLLCELSPSKYR